MVPRLFPAQCSLTVHYHGLKHAFIVSFCSYVTCVHRCTPPSVTTTLRLHHTSCWHTTAVRCRLWTIAPCTAATPTMPQYSHTRSRPQWASLWLCSAACWFCWCWQRIITMSVSVWESTQLSNNSSNSSDLFRAATVSWCQSNWKSAS